GTGEPGAVPRQREADAGREPAIGAAQWPGRDRARAASLRRLAAGPLTHAVEQARAEGLLENLLAGDALAQDLAGGRRVVEPVHVPAPDLRRAHVQAL